MQTGDTVTARSNAEIYDYILLKYGGKTLKAWSLKDVAININATMFAYKNLPDSIPQEFIERFLVLGDPVVFWKLDDPNAVRYKDELIVSPGGYSDQPDCYGLGERIIVSTLSGYTKHDLIPGKDCVVMHNNSIYTPDIAIISQAVDLMTEMFTSLKTNIIYSRLKPVFKATTDKEKAAIETAFNSIKDDSKPIVITSKNVIEEELEGSEAIKVLEITDVKNADKLQYIVKAIDDVMRWYLTLYGQAIQGNAKLAQQTVDEVQGTTSASFILPNDKLRMRKKAIEEVNALFGTDIEVDFSDAWKTESVKYKKEADIDENGELEELDEETVEETVEEPETEPEEEPEEEKEDKENE